MLFTERGQDCRIRCALWRCAGSAAAAGGGGGGGGGGCVCRGTRVCEPDAIPPALVTVFGQRPFTALQIRGRRRDRIRGGRLLGGAPSSGLAPTASTRAGGQSADDRRFCGFARRWRREAASGAPVALMPVAAAATGVGPFAYWQQPPVIGMVDIRTGSEYVRPGMRGDMSECVRLCPEVGHTVSGAINVARGACRATRRA